MLSVTESSLFSRGGNVEIHVQSDKELEERVDALFNELKSDIQNIEFKELSLLAPRLELIGNFLNRIGLSSAIELPPACDAENQAIPLKVERFLQKFANLSQKEKVLVSQKLFNASYDRHAAYYFMFPSFVLSQAYPKLMEYINFRDSTVERIFTPKGIRFAVEEWKTCEKLPSTLDYIVCENVAELADHIQGMLQKDSTQVIYFLQMDCNESLTGDHTVPIL